MPKARRGRPEAAWAVGPRGGAEAEEGGGAAAVITEEAAEAAVAEADAMNEARQTNLRCLVADLPAEASILNHGLNVSSQSQGNRAPNGSATPTAPSGI